jgi:hypothetical protein
MAAKKETKSTETGKTEQGTGQKTEDKGSSLKLAGSGLPLAVNSGHLDVSVGGIDAIATVGSMYTRTDLMVTSKEGGQKIGALEKVQNGLRVAIAEQETATLAIKLETAKVKTATAAAEYSGAVSDLKDEMDKATHKEVMQDINSQRREHIRREAIADTVIAASRADKKEGKAQGLAANDESLTSLYNSLKQKYEQVNANKKSQGWEKDGKQ